MSISTETFKAAMGQLASGVTIITAHAGGEDHGFTATSFTSVSLDPMLVLVCVMKSNRGHDLIERGGCFAANLLSAEQQELGARFAVAKEEDRFRDLAIMRAYTGAAILPGNLAWVDCVLKHSYPGGDHTIFVGEVVAGEAPGGKEALLYYNRQWGRFSG